MLPTNQKTVINEDNRPVAVLIDYQDWKKIETFLATHQSQEEAIWEPKEPLVEVKFSLLVRDIPEAHQQEAEARAKEAYVMTLLRHGDISTGRAARLLEIPRVELLDLMGEYGISVFPDYTPQELEREVEQAMRVLEKNKQ